jgi:hypothetical protein
MPDPQLRRTITVTTTTDTPTDTLIRNLAALSCILQGKDLPELPYISVFAGKVDAHWYLDIHGADLAKQKEYAETLLAVIGGEWTVDADDRVTGWTQTHPGVFLEVRVARQAVCERVVTGAREVTIEVPDPNAPKIAKIVTVEDVEWRCIDDLAQVTA